MTPANRLFKKSSSTLLSEEKSKASSVISTPDSMYKHTLRVQHTTKETRKSNRSAAESTHGSIKSSAATTGKLAPVISTKISSTPSVSEDFDPPAFTVYQGTGSTSREKKGADSGIGLNVHDSCEGLWKKIMFPPGITVGQARDICMLRFNVWQRIMEQDMKHMSIHSQESECNSSVHTMSSKSSVKSTSQQYALYWPGGSEWLNENLLLSMYPLRPGESLVLQDREVSVRRVADAVADFGDAQAKAIKTAAEGQVYYLYSKGISTSWKLCWLVLRSQTLCGYPSDHGGTGAASDKKMLEVDLSKGFLLVDQHGHENHMVATSDQLQTKRDTDGKSTGASMSMRSGSGSSSGSSSGSGLGAVLGLATAHRQQLGNDGAPLIVRSASGGVYVFCTQTAVDYDHWRRVLCVAQGPGVSSSQHNSSVSSSPPPVQPPVALTSLVHRPKEHRPAHVVARPRRERFVANAFRRQSGSGTGSFCCCVVVPGAIHGFGDMSVATNADSDSLGRLAEFSVQLVAQSTAAVSEIHGGRHVLRIIDCVTANDLLWLDVGSRDKSGLWIEALGRIAGVHVDCSDTQSIAGLGPRRSRSFAVNLSRIDWPMPPTTLPSVSPKSDSDTPAELPAELPAKLPAELPASATSSSADNSRAIDGNPSLDAVGMHFSDSASEEQRLNRMSLLSSRFAWLRRIQK
ncbi:hypothetical protein LPJ57_000353 [Coemansia sp. RSA 486]|nr:hypothetical protein LPJ57_000353 [Coemansia sp. RSA 486]